MAEGTITSSIGTTVVIDGDELTNIQSIGELGGDAADIDVTNLKDRETSLLPGVKAVPSIDIVCFKEKEEGGNYEWMRTMESDAAPVPVTITFPDSTGVSFNARVKTKLGAVAINGAITFTVSLYKTGDFTDF